MYTTQPCKIYAFTKYIYTLGKQLSMTPFEILRSSTVSSKLTSLPRKMSLCDVTFCPVISLIFIRRRLPESLGEAMMVISLSSGIFTLTAMLP